MSNVQEQFEIAVTQSTQLPEKPGPQVMLKLYSLYKQATEGDNAGEKPGFSDVVARAKWDAWNNLKGINKETAQQRYIDVIEELKNA